LSSKIVGFLIEKSQTEAMEGKYQIGL